MALYYLGGQLGRREKLRKVPMIGALNNAPRAACGVARSACFQALAIGCRRCGVQRFGAHVVFPRFLDKAWARTCLLCRSL